MIASSFSFVIAVVIICVAVYNNNNLVFFYYCTQFFSLSVHFASFAIAELLFFFFLCSALFIFTASRYHLSLYKGRARARLLIFRPRYLCATYLYILFSIFDLSLQQFDRPYNFCIIVKNSNSTKNSNSKV